VLFPLWWVGAVWRVPQTRTVGGTDTEKAVPLDDPQIEFGAHSFRPPPLPFANEAQLMT